MSLNIWGVRKTYYHFVFLDKLMMKDGYIKLLLNGENLNVYNFVRCNDRIV